MSVQNEITRLNAAKAAISQAIAEKGVTVPNGAKLDELGALIAAIEAGGGSGGNTLWNGGKFTMGSFVLAEEVTSEYVIATNSDSAMLDLLSDGERLSDQIVYRSIGLIVVVKPKSVSLDSSYKANVMCGSFKIPTYFGSGGASVSFYVCWDQWGSSVVKNGAGSKGPYVGPDKLSVHFTTSEKGSPNFEYLWLAWRGVRE